MESLKDSYTIIKWDGVNEEKVWFEEDVKEAVFRFNQEIELLKNLDFSMYVIIKQKTDEIFGDWEE